MSYSGNSLPAVCVHFFFTFVAFIILVFGLWQQMVKLLKRTEMNGIR